jgi:Undecaprenyl-phosphate glucose phosphotransferase
MLNIKALLNRLLDIVLIVAGALLAYQFGFSGVVPAKTAAIVASATAFSVALSLAVFHVCRVYSDQSAKSLGSLLGQTEFAWITTQLCGLLVTFCIHRSDLVSRLWFGYWTLATAAALALSRIIARIILGRVRHAKSSLRSVAIVGASEHCDALIRKMQASRESGFHAVMTLDPQIDHQANSAAIPRHTSIQTFVRLVRADNVRELWLAMPLSEQPLITRLVKEFKNDLINIRFFPDVSSLSLFDAGVIDMIGMPAINLVASPLSPLALANKDLFDRGFAAVALILLSPLMLAIGLAVKLTSPGPVLFTQNRKGADGQVFRIFKFRSMSVHAHDEGVLKQATRNDPRVTRVGAFLRRTSLDELPQFINVLIGDMSVVGPRPHAIEHDALYQTVVDDYIHRYRIKPGITGWAQINNFRGETDRVEKMQGRVDHDLYYLRNWSFSLDIRIVAATILKGLKHSNAY